MAVQRLNFWVVIPTGGLVKGTPRAQDFVSHIQTIQESLFKPDGIKNIDLRQSGILVVNNSNTGESIDATSKVIQSSDFDLKVNRTKFFPVQELQVGPGENLLGMARLKGLEYVFGKKLQADLAIIKNDNESHPPEIIGTILENYLQTTDPWDIAIILLSHLRPLIEQKKK